MVQSGKLILPVVIWSSKPPHMSISSVVYGNDVRLIIYGTTSGHIVLVHYEDSESPTQGEAFAVIEAHADVVNSITLYQEPTSKHWHFTSSSEDGDLVTWNLDSFTSVKHRKFNFTTTKLQAFTCSPSGAVRLFCVGHYQDMRVIDPISLVILFNLVSRVSPDWISAFTIFHLASKKENVVVAITQSAVAKVWTFGDTAASDTITENESKPIRACNVVDLVCCPQSRRTALVVCSKYWQVYDLSDFSTLCQQSVPASSPQSRGERWIGGVFLNLSSVLVWSTTGTAYVYRLPSNSVAGSDSFHTVAPDQVASPELLYKYVVHSPSQSADTHNNNNNNNASTTCQSMCYSGPLRLLVAGDNVGGLFAWRVASLDKTLSRSSSGPGSVVEPGTVIITDPLWRCSLNDTWSEYRRQVVKQSSSSSIQTKQSWSWFGNGAPHVTVTVFITESQRLVCGLDDGRIAICPANEILQDCLVGKGNGGPEHLQMLEGHVPSRVTALLYPYADDPRYDPDQLLSGGADFAVCVWSLRQGARLHRFTVQAGEILRLLVTPPNCTVLRLLSCVCSIASDNSVALLNVKEQRCHLLASQHPYPVSLIRWRPAHDFMLVRLTNGDVYVWEMETGHLDRVVSSIRAEAVLTACEMDSIPGTTVDVVMQPRKKNRHIMNQLHRRLRFHHTSTAAPISPAPNSARGSAPLASQQSSSAFKLPPTPVHIQPLHLSVTGYAADALVAYIDIETLIINLAVERFTSEQSKYATDPQVTSLKQPLQPGSPLPGQHLAAPDASSTPQIVCEPTKVLRLIFSILHSWGLSPEIDAQLVSRLNITPPPLSPATCFGAIVAGQLFALMPGWLGVIAKRSASYRPRSASSASSATAAISSSNPFAADLAAAATPANPETWALRCYWASGSLLTAARLLPIVSLANAVARLEQIGTQMQPRPSSASASSSSSSSSVPATSSAPPAATATPSGVTGPPRPPPPTATSRKLPSNGQDAQLWLQVCTMYTVLLPDLVGQNYRAPPLQALANRFHDQCLAIRDAAQSLLSAELSRVGAAGRKTIVDMWAPYLPLSTGVSGTISCTSIRPPLYLSSSDTVDDLHELICPQQAPAVPSIRPPAPAATPVAQNAPTPTLSLIAFSRQYDATDLRRLQATAVILLSIIGTDFGQAVVSPKSAEAPAITSQPAMAPSTDVALKSFVEGFSVADSVLAQATACALAYLVSAGTDQLNALAAVRRSAASLIGRGFGVWEPYLDISQVLLALLALCPAAASEQSNAWNSFVNSGDHQNVMTSFIPLSPAADASRTARHSLALIATSRPKQFIVSIATEVRRFYASSSSSSSSSSASQSSASSLISSAFGGGASSADAANAAQFTSDPKSPAALAWARSDIIRLLDSLVERYPNDVQDFLLEAVDIAVFCLDPSALRGRTLADFVPHLARIPSVAFCVHSQRIAVGGRTGLLVFYEPPKSVSAPGGPLARFASQAVNAHGGQAVTELLFSPDGRHLASYSAGHRKVSFWQPASSSLFSSSSSQLMKLVRSVAAPAVPLERVAAAQRSLPRLLFWSDRSTLHLRLGTAQNDEFTFAI